ncbi:MAG: hypothetical protein HYY58_04425, partial [Candidatus Omnitrophica bacterium]|nr:hypothetical protein [Candidatus Omnitrophota bacterium]
MGAPSVTPGQPSVKWTKTLAIIALAVGLVAVAGGVDNLWAATQEALRQMPAGPATTTHALAGLAAGLGSLPTLWIGLAGLAALVWTARHVRSPTTTFRKAVVIPALMTFVTSLVPASVLPSTVRTQLARQHPAAEARVAQLSTRPTVELSQAAEWGIFHKPQHLPGEVEGEAQRVFDQELDQEVYHVRYAVTRRWTGLVGFFVKTEVNPKDYPILLVRAKAGAEPTHPIWIQIKSGGETLDKFELSDLTTAWRSWTHRHRARWLIDEVVVIVADRRRAGELFLDLSFVKASGGASASATPPVPPQEQSRTLEPDQSAPVIPDVKDLKRFGWGSVRFDAQVTTDGWITLAYELTDAWGGTKIPLTLKPGVTLRVEVEGLRGRLELKPDDDDRMKKRIRSGTTEISWPVELHSLTLGLVRGEVPAKGQIRLRFTPLPPRRSEVPMGPSVTSGTAAVVGTKVVSDAQVSGPVAAQPPAEKSVTLSGDGYLQAFDFSRVNFLHDEFYQLGMSLDGTWDVVSYLDGDGKAVVGSKAGRPTIETPGHWIDHGYFDVTGTTLRRTFTAPAKEEGKRLLLHFGGSIYYTSVKLNGQTIKTSEGEETHEGYFMPFEYDITDLAKYGQENVLEVTVRNPNEQGDIDLTTANGGTGFPHWGANKRDVLGVLDFHDTKPGGADHQKFNVGGLWQPIRILTVDARARISTAPMINTTLVPKAQLEASDFDRREAQVNLSIPVENATVMPVKAQLVVRIKPENFAGDDRDAIEWSQEVELAPGQQDIDMAGVIKDAKLWWPWHLGKPNLYRAEIEVRVGDELVSQRTMRFGVRELTGDMRGMWYLNGRLLRVLGDNVIPSLTPGSYTREDAVRDGRLIIDANVQLVRVHAHVPHPYFLEMADQLGILVWQDFPQQWLSRWDEEYRNVVLQQIVPFARQTVSHPSVVVLNTHNENKYFDPPNAHGLPKLSRGVWMHASEPAEQLDRDAQRVITEFYANRFSTSVAVRPKVGVFILDETGADYHPYYGYYYGEGVYDYWWLPNPGQKGVFRAYSTFDPAWGWREEGHPDPKVGATPTTSYERLAGGGGLNQFGPDEFGFQGFSRSAVHLAIRDVLKERDPSFSGDESDWAIDRAINEIPWGYLYAPGELPKAQDRTEAQKLFVTVIDKLSEHNFHAWAFPIWIKPEKPLEQITLDDVIREHQNYQAWGAQVTAEIYRRAGYGQPRFLLFSSEDDTQQFYSLNWAVLESDRAPKKAYVAVKRAYQRILASSEILSQRLLPGERWLSGLWINNDTYHEFNGTSIVIGLRDKDGKLIKQQRIEKDLPAFEILNLSQLVPGEFWTVSHDTMPGDYTLTLAVYDVAGRKLSENRYELRVLPNDLLAGLEPETQVKVDALLKSRFETLRQKFDKELQITVAPEDGWAALMAKLQISRTAHWKEWKAYLEANPELLLDFPEFTAHIQALVDAKLKLDAATQSLEASVGQEGFEAAEAMTLAKQRLAEAQQEYDRVLLRTQQTLQLHEDDLTVLLGERGWRIPIPLLYGKEVTTDEWFKTLINELSQIKGAEQAVDGVRQYFNTRAGHWFDREVRMLKALQNTLAFAALTRLDATTLNRLGRLAEAVEQGRVTYTFQPLFSQKVVERPVTFKHLLEWSEAAVRERLTEAGYGDLVEPILQLVTVVSLTGSAPSHETFDQVLAQVRPMTPDGMLPDLPVPTSSWSEWLQRLLPSTGAVTKGLLGALLLVLIPTLGIGGTPEFLQTLGQGTPWLAASLDFARDAVLSAVEWTALGGWATTLGTTLTAGLSAMPL